MSSAADVRCLWTAALSLTVCAYSTVLQEERRSRGAVSVCCCCSSSSSVSVSVCVAINPPHLLDSGRLCAAVTEQQRRQHSSAHQQLSNSGERSRDTRTRPAATMTHSALAQSMNSQSLPLLSFCLLREWLRHLRAYWSGPPQLVGYQPVWAWGWLRCRCCCCCCCRSSPARWPSLPA